MAQQSDSMETVEHFVLCVLDGTETLVPATIKGKSSNSVYAITEYELPDRAKIHMLPCEPTDIFTAEQVVHSPGTLSGTIASFDRQGGFIVRVSPAHLAKLGKDQGDKGVSVQTQKRKKTPSRSKSAHKDADGMREEKGSSVHLRYGMRDGVLLVEVSGVLNVSGAALLDRVARRALRERCPVVLSVGQVEEIPSAGLGVLIALVRDLQERGLNAAVCDATSTVKRVLDISRLGQLIHAYSDFDEARNALMNG